MRTRMIATGAVLLTSLLLAGCSGASTTAEETAAPTTTAKPSPTATPTAEVKPVDTCPDLAVGATIDAAVLATCVGEAAANTAGYALSASMGGMDVTGKLNPADKAMEVTMPIGSIIRIGDAAWVQIPGGAWQASDPGSADPRVAALSAATAGLESFDVTSPLSGLTGTLTVTGEDTLLGEKVFVATGDLDAGGVVSAASYSLTQDWVPFASQSDAIVNGTPVKSQSTMLEWNAKQDIQPPL